MLIDHIPPRITHDEAIAWAQLRDAGQTEGDEVKRLRGRNALAEGNLRLVFYCLQRTVGYGDYRATDLFSEGILGLLRAAERWQWQQGAKFSTYAIWFIWQKINRWIKGHSSDIYFPIHSVEMACRAAEWEAKTGERASNDTSLPVVVSLDAPIWISPQNGKPLTLHEVIPDTGESPTETASGHERRARLREAIDAILPPHESQILILRYGLGDPPQEMTFEEVGKIQGCAKQCVQQREASAIKRLRHARRKAARVLREV